MKKKKKNTKKFIKKTFALLLKIANKKWKIKKKKKT